jgi:ABC-type Na+ transport system ATPase subunit NatA
VEASEIYPSGAEAIRGISFDVREGEIFGTLAIRLKWEILASTKPSLV